MTEDKKPKGKKKLVSRRDFLVASGAIAAAGASAVVTPSKVFAADRSKEGAPAEGGVSGAPPAGATSSGSSLPTQVFGASSEGTRHLILEPQMPGQRKIETAEFECDVLVVGAGYAGTMAAVAAHEKGQKVIVVCKQIIGKSGLSPWANTLLFYDESLGDVRENFLTSFQRTSEYIVDQDYLDLFLNGSLKCFKLWKEFGIYNRNYIFPSAEELIKYSKGEGDPQDRRWRWPLIFKNKGIQTVERVMLTNLLMANDGGVAGAVGFHVESDEVLIFRSKAVVMCTGAGGFKTGGFPINGNTADGDWMAYNVGAKIGGKEWNDFHSGGATYPSDSWGNGDQRWLGPVYAKGPSARVPGKGGGGSRNASYVRTILQAHEQGISVPSSRRGSGRRTTNLLASGSSGYVPLPNEEDYEKWENVRYDQNRSHPPMYWPELPMRTNPTGVARVRAGASAIGLGCHCTEGIFPVDAHCWSGVPGLWAAGDSLCSRLSGAYYSNVGSSSSSAGVYGYHAGEQASDYASGRSRPVISQDELDKAKNDVLEPRTRTAGFGPHWIQELVLQVYAPYWIHTMKHAERIKNALQTTEYIRDYIASKAKATDPHHNRLCHEAKHMVLLLEMKLRASLIREESRGLHFREDFPYRDDKNWLAWTACQNGSDGKMEAIKMPMPDRMKIDMDWTYTERYKINYPGEEEALAELGIKI